MNFLLAVNECEITSEGFGAVQRGTNNKINA